MEIFSLSGASGTGKSTSALSFAHQKKIPAIIDDGLLIINGYKVAGTSAKFEKHTLSAVKRATFWDEMHIKEVQEALKIYYVRKLLIIGTSEKMTKIIANRLQVGPINHFFHVEDIRSSSEIKMAQYIRKTEGKHIIPIPYKQVEQSFFKRLIQKGKDIFSPKKERIGETTIVFPDFHRGAIQINRQVFVQIIERICLNTEEIHQCNSVHVQLDGLPIVDLHIALHFPIDYHLTNMLEHLQNDIQNSFLQYMNIEFASINITVNNILCKKKTVTESK